MSKTNKRTYVITCEWPEDFGPEWMNQDNLMLALNKGCPAATWTVVGTVVQPIPLGGPVVVEVPDE